VLEVIHAAGAQIEWNVKVVVQAGAGLQIQKRQLALRWTPGRRDLGRRCRRSRGATRGMEEQRNVIEAAKMAQAGMTMPGQEGQNGEADKKGDSPK
jgi:hypothetical protein